MLDGLAHQSYQGMVQRKKNGSTVKKSSKGKIMQQFIYDMSLLC